VGHASSYLPPFSFSLLVRLREGEKGRWREGRGGGGMEG